MASYPADEKAVDKSTDLARAHSVDEKHDTISSDGSSYVEGSEGVTEHELATLRHVADRLPAAAWLVVIVEFAERFVLHFSSTAIYIYKSYPGGPTTAQPTSITTIYVRGCLLAHSTVRFCLSSVTLVLLVLLVKVYKRLSRFGL